MANPGSHMLWGGADCTLIFSLRIENFRITARAVRGTSLAGNAAAEERLITMRADSDKQDGAVGPLVEVQQPKNGI